MAEIKGYKVFNNDWTCNNEDWRCQDDYQFEVGQTYKMYTYSFCGPVSGFEFYEKLEDCFLNNCITSDSKIAEILAIGKINRRDGKSYTDEIHLVRELSKEEITNATCKTYGNIGTNRGFFNEGNYNECRFIREYWNIAKREVPYVSDVKNSI